MSAQPSKSCSLIAPLGIELDAALPSLDKLHEGDFPVERGDNYVYFAGRMCDRNVVIASFPRGTTYGTSSAAALISQVQKTFRNLWLVFFVGVAAGVPDLSSKPTCDIRLGDVLVAAPEGEVPAIVHYGLGKETKEGLQLLLGGHSLGRTEALLMSAIMKLEHTPASSTLHFRNNVEKFDPDIFSDPGQDKDILYGRNNELVYRPKRKPADRAEVWLGPMGSGDKLWKDANKRDEMRETYKIIGLEMEGAGVNTVACAVMIRGVCDYGNHRKNKEWQAYAAAMAAAYAQAVLVRLPPPEIPAAAQKMLPHVEHKVLGDSRATPSNS
ncbi:purine and uridine phosphorylase [Lentithecium fluviatile CBS 122367]|uniref:Purine and uridine phosphorylase n=1 Tax=Lentithecium fluviatile CBS 122367 TaxID=1168545 RepID=A0A6G1JKT4_9PLEO|nr:purine and uridine phosphorylase [Lentithecium fluviatile CBS 122367]